MRSYLISKLINVLMRELAKHAPGLLLQFAAYVLDWIEERVLGSASKLDDKLILPLCKMIRDAYDIEDMENEGLEEPEPEEE
jgi:hypothetical protein